MPQLPCVVSFSLSHTDSLTLTKQCNNAAQSSNVDITAIHGQILHVSLMTHPTAAQFTGGKKVSRTRSGSRCRVTKFRNAADVGVMAGIRVARGTLWAMPRPLRIAFYPISGPSRPRFWALDRAEPFARVADAASLCTAAATRV